MPEFEPEMTKIDQVDQQIQAMTEQLQMHHTNYCQTLGDSQKVPSNQLYLKNRQ